ncbi:MAG: hypothetical protein HN654_03105 [Candidatus Marinimicrobia bacterium]|nr:hypothetical protein [Candidatus Neomarinimicrobiota bacterium]
MFNKFHIVTLVLSLVTAPIFSQDIDTTDFEEESGNEMFTSVDLSYSQDKGNTDFLSLYYGFSFSVLGDVGPLTDTEFSINFSRSDDKLDGESFTDDQSFTSQFDLWANQRISPFLFFQYSYDKTIGLENRMNAGAGAKIGLLKGFSISYAFLFEKESYKLSEISGIDSTLMTYYYYEDFYEYDTTYSIATTDSSFFRHSIRPKYKVKLFDGNVVFDYRFYFKPRIDNFDDYLLEHELKISIVTFYEALSVDFNYTNKYNARYDDGGIINPDTGMDYADTDENISVGLSFMF